MPRPLPAAYNALLESEKEAASIAAIRFKERQSINDAKETDLYRKLAKALSDYNDVVIDGGLLTIKKNRTKKYIELFVDGRLWMKFVPKWSHWSCSCEAPCDHESSSSLSFESTQYRQVGEIRIYFDCREEDLDNGSKFAEAMKSVMADWKYEEMRRDRNYK